MKKETTILPIISQNQMEGFKYVENEWAAGVNRKPRLVSRKVRKVPLVSGRRALYITPVKKCVGMRQFVNFLKIFFGYNCIKA